MTDYNTLRRSALCKDRPGICKIMQSIIRDKILTHFKVNMLFTDKQFGFIKGRATITDIG